MTTRKLMISAHPLFLAELSTSVRPRPFPAVYVHLHSTSRTQLFNVSIYNIIITVVYIGIAPDRYEWADRKLFNAGNIIIIIIINEKNGEKLEKN